MMIAACVLARLCDGVSATRLSPSLVDTVPDVTVAVATDEPCWTVSTDEIFEPGDSGDTTICADASLLLDMESLGSSAVPTVLVPPLPLELTTNEPRDAPIWRE